MRKPLLLIVARDKDGGIGRQGDLPWHLPSDLKFFQNMTRETDGEATQNAVIMGRKTWESIPPRFRPLKGRVNIVVSRNEAYDTGDATPVCTSLNAAIALAVANERVERVFVVGGGMLYAEVLKREDLCAAWITEIEGHFDCDTFFPALPARFVPAETRTPITENEVSYSFVRYEPVPPVS